jgi:hypothetical protein
MAQGSTQRLIEIITKGYLLGGGGGVKAAGA